MIFGIKTICRQADKVMNFIFVGWPSHHSQEVLQIWDALIGCRGVANIYLAAIWVC